MTERLFGFGPAERTDGTLVHLVRHGEAQHQVVAREAATRGITCRCYEPGVSAEARARCPYLDPRNVDSPLSADGRAQARGGLREAGVGLVVCAASSRALETALLLEAGAPIIALDELRPLASAHTHSQRRPLSVLRREFPTVQFSGVTEEDTFHDEGREAIDARMAGFLRFLGERSEARIAVVTHYTVILALLSGPGHELVFGGGDAAPWVDCRRSAQAAELMAELPAGGVRLMRWTRQA